MTEILNLKNVSFAYNQNVVLKNINLTIHEGEFVGIIGKNGSGKSTLLKLIIGQLKPNNGDVTLNKNKKIGYVEQVTITSDNSFPASVQEIVMLGLYREIGFLKLPNTRHKQRVSDALEMVGLSGFEKRQITFLSGGQQQKVLIAKALVSNPDILILDEPTTGIDNHSEEEFINLLKHLNTHHNKTIIMVTHNYSKLSGANKIYTVDEKQLKESKNV